MYSLNIGVCMYMYIHMCCSLNFVFYCIHNLCMYHESTHYLSVYIRIFVCVCVYPPIYISMYILCKMYNIIL